VIRHTIEVDVRLTSHGVEDLQEQEQASDGDGHAPEVDLIPEVVNEANFKLEREDQTHIDGGAHLVETVFFKRGCDHIEPNETEDDGVETSVEEPETNGSCVEMLIGETSGVDLHAGARGEELVSGRWKMRRK
jgi:hypothetical protein